MLMKWLFLFNRQHPLSVSSYDFVPYNFGPFSFEAQQNLNQTLTRYVQRFGNDFKLREGTEDEVRLITGKIKQAEQIAIDQIWLNTGRLALDDLLDDVYSKYPWYASRSKRKPCSPQADAHLAVYTSGYEGKSVDAFLDSLLRHSIKGVIDVRRNAFSQKYGFSKVALHNLCNKVGIKYDHIPELGVASELRKDLSGEDAFAKLFDDYENNLPEQSDALSKASKIVKSRPTTLLCFEAASEQCHRGRLAPKIAAQTDLQVKHL